MVSYPDRGFWCYNNIIRHGTTEQKRKYLPGIAKGELEFCLALTEPDAGSNTLNIKTRARKEGNNWIISGNKVLLVELIELRE